MTVKSALVRLSALAFLLLAATNATAQDELRKTFFKDADLALDAANAANAQLLSPKNYERATTAYQAGDQGLARGRNIDYVRTKTADAEKYYKAAAEAADLAKTVLSQVMKSRQDAANARAPELSADLWTKAQRQFDSAIRYLERGDLKRAKRMDIEATIIYRDAELVSIKAEYLNETRRLISDANRAKVDRYAPITLSHAISLLAEAEKELNENRYDTDRPRSLAKQANYEAKHAIYLSGVVRDVKDKKPTVEQLVLQWEDPLRQIAGAADILPLMSDGHDVLQEELVAYIENMRNLNQSLAQESEESLVRLGDMEEEIRALDQRLGGATAERVAAAFKLILSNEKVTAILVNIFGGIVRCDLIAEGIISAVKEVGVSVPVVVRLEGTNVDKGRSLLAESGLDIIAANDLTDAAQKVVVASKS